VNTYRVDLPGLGDEFFAPPGPLDLMPDLPGVGHGGREPDRRNTVSPRVFVENCGGSRYIKCFLGEIVNRATPIGERGKHISPLKVSPYKKTNEPEMRHRG
jgi:hypothetical protein